MTTPSPAAKRASRLWLLLVPVVILAGGYYIYQATTPKGDDKGGPGAQGPGGKGKKRPSPVVSVAKVEVKDVPLQEKAIGTAAPLNTVVVRARVDGQLQKILFKEGQMVSQGQVLVELDPRPFQIAILQAEGQLMKDQALLGNAQLDLQRYRTLLSQNSASKQQVDTQEALVKQYQGTVKVDQAALENARLQLTYSRVQAPVAGRIGLKQVDLGNMVRSSDANGIVVITQVKPMMVVFSLPETRLSKVLEAKDGARSLKVEAWDRDNQNRLATGTLESIDNQLNTATSTVSLKARFDDSAKSLYPNQFVNVRLQLGTLSQALTVPTTAIQDGRDGRFVYTTEGKTAHVRKVVTGPTDGLSTVIYDGLKPGETVITDGVDKLRDGADVKISDPKSKGEKGDRSKGHKPAGH